MRFSLKTQSIKRSVDGSDGHKAIKLCCVKIISIVGMAHASPLDDQIATFSKSPEQQSETTVVNLLKTGLTEARSAEAFVAVKPWMARQQPRSAAGLLVAGRVAEQAGEWSAAAEFYKTLLKNPKVDARIATTVVPGLYRLIINYLGEPEAAYSYMRLEGNRLRAYGEVKKFDRWFLDEAEKRNDVPAVCERLVTILADGSSRPEQFESDLKWTCEKLESFKYEDETWYPAALKLGNAQRVPAVYRARLKWACTVVPYNRELDELRNANAKTVNPKLTDAPLAAAAELLRVTPDEGAFLVAQGWGVEYDHHHSGNCEKRFMVEGERKLAQLLGVIPRMSADKRDDLLAIELARGRVKFNLTEIRKAVIAHPGMLNRLDVADVHLFDKTITVEEARALAPQLARNPHAQAAMVRAWALPERKYSAATDFMMKSEMWRFEDVKRLTHGLWHSGMFERDVEHDVPIKKYEKLNARYQQLKKQVRKEASTQERMAALNALRKDLSGNPSIPGALPLWDELFANASDSDKVPMLKALTTNTIGDHLYLLHRALGKSAFGAKGSGRLPWVADVYDNHFRYHQNDVRKNAPELLQHFEDLVRNQMSGTFSETIFGLWLHSVEVRKQEAQVLMAEIVKSPAYAKLDPAYHKTAADRHHFGALALTPALAVSHPDFLSRELKALPKKPEPAQVEVAFKAAMDRLAKAPTPASLSGLEKVAALSEWSDATRKSVLSLFKEHSPIGPHPAKQGYEALVVRIAKDAEKTQQWGALEPYAAGLWYVAGTKDDPRSSGAIALSLLADAALKGDAPSVAATLSRSALRGQAGRTLFYQKDWDIPKIKERVRNVHGKAVLAIGAVEIPVAESDPTYPVYKSNAEFVQGNLDAAWSWYEKGANQLMTETEGAKPLLHTLSVDYAFWLIAQVLHAELTVEAEQLIKELTIWSRVEQGLFSSDQDARLKIAYADLALLKGALPTSRAWYQKVADVAEYKGTPVYVDALLGMVRVDRQGKNYSSAMNELDKLMQVSNPSARLRGHLARAEIFVDQENFAEGFEEIDAVLRVDPNHPDALLLRGQAQLHMRKLDDAKDLPIGVSKDQKLIVPGQVIKIDLNDPGLNVAGIGADIEVEIWAASGDRERVMLRQLGDNKDKFRAEVPTALAPPAPGDKTLQVLGRDKVQYGYSKRFRAKMKDLPPDPEVVIEVASDARLDITSGAFPPRAGERKLDVEELGLSTAQAALGARTVRPGNPFYIRVIDFDQSKTGQRDEIMVSVESSSGDRVAQLKLTETDTHSGEFTAMLPTATAQAMAVASESAPGREANMALSAKPYPGWAGQTGSAEDRISFSVDLNDDVPLGKVAVICGEADKMPGEFVLQTSMNGKSWTERARYPSNPVPWDGRPRIRTFPTHGRAIKVSVPEKWEVPADWKEAMDYGSVRESIPYDAGVVSQLGEMKDVPLASGGHPGYPVVMHYRALFYQPAREIRRFKLTGFPPKDDKGNITTIFLLDGKPVTEDAEDPMLIERELAPGLHEIEVWRHESRNELLQRVPKILCNAGAAPDLVPCPDRMFDPASFPAGLQTPIDQPATIAVSENDPTAFEFDFHENTRARMFRLVMLKAPGKVPGIRKITLTDREGVARLPVKLDYQQLWDNQQLEVIPGDTISVNYVDDRFVSKGRDRHARRLQVAFNTATVQVSFLNYETTETGRRLMLEDIRRFKMDDSIAVVITDPDLDGSPERDVLEFTVSGSNGSTAKAKAVETEVHSGMFIGRIFPVSGPPSRESEIQITEGATLTATYRDMENLDPGIPTDRSVTVEHAQYTAPQLAVYNVSSESLSRELSQPEQEKGPEIILPRRGLTYTYTGPSANKQGLNCVLGASLRFDVVVPHLALAGSSTIHAYVHTGAGRKAAKEAVSEPFDIRVPGTLKLEAQPTSVKVDAPDGYAIAQGAVSPSSQPQLDEGRFSFSVPLILEDLPQRSFAVNTDGIPRSSLPEGLAVQGGDSVYIGFAYKDESGEAQWRTAAVKVDSHAFLDVMNATFRHSLTNAYVGENVHVRVLAPGLDRGPGRDITSVKLKAETGAEAMFQLRETEAHSGLFKGVFPLAYADEELPAQLPPVELNGFPVRYGDTVTISYPEVAGEELIVAVNRGADGGIEPFSKRFGQDEIAVRTHFTLAECFFELAKQHKQMEQESLARREIAHAQKLLQEAIATHRDDEMRAQAEYLLGNLAQEYAALAKNDAAQMQLYQDALSRFSKIPLDYPDTEFAPKAQFKTALVYEKMGEIDISVEEYVKLAYKYPDCEYIPEVMSRLGSYFQKRGQDLKEQADPLVEKEDAESKGKVIKIMADASVEFKKAALVFAKLERRFPEHSLAGLAGLRAAQNHMRASDYQDAIAGFERVIENETYDGREIRAQAMFWCGLSYERMDDRGYQRMEAYEWYRRTTFDFPDSNWAKRARGRLADPVFESIIRKETLKREQMLEALKNRR